MKWFNNQKISIKVFLTSLIFIILIAGISFQGIVSMNNADSAFKKFYADRFVPVRQLNILFKGLMQVRINMLQEKIAIQLNNKAEFDKRLKSSGEIHKKNANIWKEYMATTLTLEEEKIAKKFIAHYDNMRKIAVKFVDALKKGDIEGSGVISTGWVKEYHIAKETMDSLIGLQQRIGDELKDEQDATAKSVFLISIILLGVAIGMGVLVTIVLSRSVSKPVDKGLYFAERLAAGDLTERIDLDQKDELGMLGKALNKAADGMEQLILNVMIAVENLSQAVQEIAAGNENLSQRTSEQASSLEEIASTIEESTSTINANADNTREAKVIADKSAVMSKEGNSVVKETVEAINEVSTLSNKMGDIIGVINDISFQTNLLALNAAVEAARAGEQGRGFAVVAGEVRNLAQRSATSAGEIEILIKDSIKNIGDSTELANKSGEALAEISSSIDAVTKFVGEISAASEEQKQGMDQINTAITEMDTMTQQNASLVEETASASEEMSNQAQELLSMVNTFKVNKEEATSVSGRSKIHLENLDQNKVKPINKNKKVDNMKPLSKQSDKKGGGQLKEIMEKDGFEEF